MNFKKLAVVSALTLALALGFVIFGGSKTKASVGGPTCNVPADYATIQAAVNDAGCTTINVSPGTYAENVSIPRAVTLRGPNAGTSGAGVRGAEANVSSLFITAGNVIVDGFSFFNAGSQVQILNVTTVLSGITVKNNIFSGYGSVGFPTNDAGNLLITRNLFRNPLPNTEAIQIKGPLSGACNGTVVSNNVFVAATNNVGAEINFSCTGTNSTNVTVAGNTDTGLAGDGPSFTAFSGVTGGIVIQNNNVTGTLTAGSAIFFFGGVTGSVLITDNVITHFGGNGIDVHFFLDGPNTGTFTFTHNDLSQNFRSIRLRDGFAPGAVVTFTRNNLSGNTLHVGAQNDSTSLTASGTCNWWGSPTGPSPSGTGDAVIGMITYSPWLVTANLDGACIGGNVATNKDQCKNDGWKTRVRSDGSTFKNQGDCVSYTNNGK